MPNDQSKKIPTLANYYQIITPKDLLGGFETHKPMDERNAGIYERAMDMLINSDRLGALTAAQMIAEVNSFTQGGNVDENSKVIHDVIQIYSDDAPPNGANYRKVGNNNIKISEIVKASPGSKSKLSVILSNSPFVSLNLRHINQVTMFLTTIPSVEMSRAVPFIDANFQFDRPALSEGTSKNQVPSLIRFLEGAVESSDVAKKMMKSYEVAIGDKKVTEIDMSLFTSPQTLTNKSLTFDATSTESPIAADIADKFRPLASLVGIQIDVRASPSYTVAYKTMKMDIVLHDRTRLAEIADMICPASYTGTTMSIRYGWSHPGDPSTNPYAELINSMVCHERYGVQNASYTFDEVGQVKITLELYMLGENQLWISRISENEGYLHVQTRLAKLKADIYNMMSALGVPLEPSARAYQILDHIDVSTNEDISDKDITEEIKKFANSIKGKYGQNNQKALDLAAVLEKAASEKKENNANSLKGMKDELKKSVSGIMASKFESLRTSADPWLPSPSDGSIHYSRYLTNVLTKDSKNKSRYTFCSLAKVIATFIQQPLQVSNKFEEVQVVYYTFNNYAGLAGGSNIGRFPVEIKILQKIVKDYLEKKGPKDMSVAEFGKLLNDAIISDPSNYAYGMHDNYITGQDGKVQLKPKLDVTVLQDKIMGERPETQGGTWQNPNVELYLECLNRQFTADEKKQAKDATSVGLILRIHVYDKVSTPWDGFMKLKSSLSRLNTSANAKAKQPTGETSLVQAQRALKDSGLNKELALADANISEVDGNLTVTKFNVTKIKKLISSFVPTLVYGANNSGIKNAAVHSSHDPRLNAVNMLRTNAATSTSPNGQGVSGLPLRVIPGTVDVSTFGCPLFCLNQQFFLDFSTNTDVDNFYGLIGLSHQISAGKFETSAKFTWMDAYGTYENISRRFTQMADVIKKNVK